MLTMRPLMDLGIAFFFRSSLSLKAFRDIISTFVMVDSWPAICCSLDLEAGFIQDSVPGLSSVLSCIMSGCIFFVAFIRALISSSLSFIPGTINISRYSLPLNLLLKDAIPLMMLLISSFGCGLFILEKPRSVAESRDGMTISAAIRSLCTDFLSNKVPLVRTQTG